MRPLQRLLLGLLPVGAAAAPALAAPPATASRPAATSPDALDLDVIDYTLPNGLRVVVSPDHRAPTVGVAVYYDVGSKDEPKGRGGLAHLVEHLLFQGSENVGPSGIEQLVRRAGGECDAVTNVDRASFFAEVPARHLEPLLFAEADRMRAPRIDEDALVREREAVRRERQLHEGQPYAPATQRLVERAEPSWALGHPVLGTPNDVAAITVDDVRGFWRDHYGPESAVLAIAGDVTEAGARALVEKYFAQLPRHGEAKRPAPSTTEAAAPATQPEQLVDPIAHATLRLEAYRVPAAHTPDWYAADLLAAALGSGESARLDDLLIEQKKVAESVEVGLDTQHLRGPGLLEVGVRAVPGREADAARLLDEELAAVAKNGLTQHELDKAKNRARAAYLTQLASNEGRAQRLAEWALLWGDPRQLRDVLGKYRAVTLADVKRVAERVLRPEGRVVVTVAPPAPPSAGPAPAGATGAERPKEQPAAAPNQTKQGGGAK